MSLPILPAIIASTLWNFVPVVPHPIDAHGWALRTRGHILDGPYLLGEEPDWHQFEVLLFNKSAVTRPHQPLRDAWRRGELRLTMVWEEKPGEHVQALCQWFYMRQDDLPAYRKPGESESVRFTLRDFGYSRFSGPGKYEAVVAFKTPPGIITSPSWTFEVVDIPDKDVLASHTVPLSGYRAKWPPDQQERITVQQMKVGNRILLVYRTFFSPKNGGGTNSAYRICELPGKVEMTVEGTYGEEMGPITIKYADKTAPNGTTTLVIRSVDGRPWTAEYEWWLKDRLRPGGGLASMAGLAPSPRLVKP